MNILYIMNVDWNWIKQRPHFIADGLSKQNSVTILYQHRYSRKGYQKRQKNNNVKSIYVIPKGDRKKIFLKLNREIWKHTVLKYCKKNKIECIYLTFPTQVNYLGDFTGTVIYDCMDNHAAFVSDESNRRELMENEKKLLKRSNVVLCSSNKLVEVLKKRYGENILPKTIVVRNGYDGNILTESELCFQNAKCNKVFAYFGTISSWFNFDYLIESLEEFPDIEYRLIGPVVDTSIPDHPRIKYIGSVEHNKLYDSIKDVACLIMPFQVNDIIESVDPVKLYEYINFGKNIIVSRYKEIERFEPFVYFYEDYSEFAERIRGILLDGSIKYSRKQREEFLAENNWNCRVTQIENMLGNILMGDDE